MLLGGILSMHRSRVSIDIIAGVTIADLDIPKKKATP
jgi:hypothetical protein